MPGGLTADGRNGANGCGRRRGEGAVRPSPVTRWWSVSVLSDDSVEGGPFSLDVRQDRCGGCGPDVGLGVVVGGGEVVLDAGDQVGDAAEDPAGHAPRPAATRPTVAPTSCTPSRPALSAWGVRTRPDMSSPLERREQTRAIKADDTCRRSSWWRLSAHPDPPCALLRRAVRRHPGGSHAGTAHIAATCVASVPQHPPSVVTDGSCCRSRSVEDVSSDRSPSSSTSIASSSA